jgi:hypothetical protein
MSPSVRRRRRPSSVVVVVRCNVVGQTFPRHRRCRCRRRRRRRPSSVVRRPPSSSSVVRPSSVSPSSVVVRCNVVGQTLAVSVFGQLRHAPQQYQVARKAELEHNLHKTNQHNLGPLRSTPFYTAAYADRPPSIPLGPPPIQGCARHLPTKRRTGTSCSLNRSLGQPQTPSDGPSMAYL